MTITDIKIKESYLRDAIGEYSKRLGRYCTLNIMEIPDEKPPKNISENDEILIKQREGKKLLAGIPEDALVVALAIEGRHYNSVEFAEKINGFGIDGISHIVFVIGGSIGLSEEVLKAADELLSFSRMTFPHQLARVMLLEQIYRAFQIMSGGKYHK